MILNSKPLHCSVFLKGEIISRKKQCWNQNYLSSYYRLTYNISCVIILLFVIASVQKLGVYVFHTFSLRWPCIPDAQWKVWWFTFWVPTLVKRMVVSATDSCFTSDQWSSFWNLHFFQFVVLSRVSRSLLFLSANVTSSSAVSGVHVLPKNSPSSYPSLQLLANW